MLTQFTSPSISAIRAQFMIEKLGSVSADFERINIFATGRTGSGKTTLANRLIGIDYFLKSTGYQDCTDEINWIQFPSELNYFDLPGVCSDDRLENYNRVALGLEQVDEFPIVDALTIAEYKDKNSEKFSSKTSQIQEKLPSPDLIFYLIAPDKQFLSADCAYLRDLLKCHPQVIYVFNLFADKQQGGKTSATPQNILDATEAINKVHKAVLGEDSQPVIVHLNCWTGEGISDLISRSAEILGGEKGKLFEELISYQSQKTPPEYVNQFKQTLLPILAQAACYKPNGTSGNRLDLVKDSQEIWHSLVNFMDLSPEIVDSIISLIDHEVDTLINQCTHHQYKKLTRKMSKKIYKSVPVFKTITEDVPDYDNPIYKWKKTKNIFKKIRNEFLYGSSKKPKIVGYHTQTVSRQVHDGYREEYSHTETWEEETGETQLVGTTYDYLNKWGVSYVLTLIYLAVEGEISENLQEQYAKLYARVSQQVEQLPEFPKEPKKAKVLEILKAHDSQLFVAAFEEKIAQLAG